MQSNGFSIGEAVRFGWDTIKKHFWFLVGITAFFYAINLFFGFIASYFDERGVAVSGIIVNIVSLIIQIMLSMGLINIFLKVHDNKETKFEDIFSQYPLFLKYLGGSILYTLIVVAPLLIVLILYILYLQMNFGEGISIFLLLLIGILMIIAIMMIVWLGLRMVLWNYFLIDKEYGPIVSLKESYRKTKGSFWNLFLFYIVLGLINLLGVAALLVGLLVSAPLSGLSTVFVYRKLSGK